MTGTVEAAALIPRIAPSVAALGWGVAAGLGGMAGALALYVGFRHAAFSVAGPISAVSAAGLAVIVGVLLGERPPALSLAGIAVALPAIVLVSLTAAPPVTSRRSQTSVSSPCLARYAAATRPLWPPPMTMASLRALISRTYGTAGSPGNAST